MKPKLLSDAGLLTAARKAAREHDVETFEPLWQEVRKRPSLADEVMPLINAIFPLARHHGGRLT